MDEVIMALFQYIVDKKLQDELDKSVIICDKILSGLLECQSVSFSELQQTLLSKNLITMVNTEDQPIVLTYIMNEKTVSPQEPIANKGASDGSGVLDDEEDDGHNQVVSFDMDVSIPSFFHYRTRELLRRIKRREFEYTSSRTKARYMLVASKGNEDIVKAKIEQAISGYGFAPENIPVFLALAKAAPPNSEARSAAQIDARTCAVVGRLDECTHRAEAAWELVDACRDSAK